jgi:hypothetical protein
MVFEPAKLPRDEHAVARHVVFFTSSPRTVLAFLTQPRRRNYVHGRRTTEGTLTLHENAEPCLLGAVYICERCDRGDPMDTADPWFNGELKPPSSVRQLNPRRPG